MNYKYFCIIALLFFSSCSIKTDQKSFKPTHRKIKAVTIHCKNRPSPETWQQFKDAGITHVVLVPKATMYTWEKTNTLQDVGGSPYWSESVAGIKDAVISGKKYGIKVIVKLHLYLQEKAISKGETEKVPFSKELGKEYREIAIRYARICQNNNIEIYILCNETTQFYRASGYWEDLIKDIRKLYTGKITIGATASAYEDVKFWDKLDYIGISAYYRVALRKNPNENEMKIGWLWHKIKLNYYSYKYSKPVLFTEFGCNANESLAVNPWTWQKSIKDEKNNYLLQAKYYSTMFDSFWSEKWFSGICIWQTYSLSEFGEQCETLGTPQGHEAWQVIKKRKA